MKKRLLIYFLAILAVQSIYGQKLILPTPSTTPNKAQQQQIARKYGMFIHFGINTFHDEEWTDGSKPASSYCPTRIDAEQWVKTAKEPPMKKKIIITKQHQRISQRQSKNTKNDVVVDNIQESNVDSNIKEK